MAAVQCSRWSALRGSFFDVLWAPVFGWNKGQQNEGRQNKEQRNEGQQNKEQRNEGRQNKEQKNEGQQAGKGHVWIMFTV